MNNMIPNCSGIRHSEVQLLITALRKIVEQARTKLATTANYELTMMYWHIGQRINRDVLGNERATYGGQIVATVSRQLQMEYGKKGFDEKNIRRMMQFASLFPDETIVVALSRQLWWSHFLEVLPLNDGLQREFYITFAANERWSVLPIGSTAVRISLFGSISASSSFGSSASSASSPVDFKVNTLPPPTSSLVDSKVNMVS